MAEEDIGGQNVGHEARHKRTGGTPEDALEFGWSSSTASGLRCGRVEFTLVTCYEIGCKIGRRTTLAATKVNHAPTAFSLTT